MQTLRTVWFLCVCRNVVFPFMKAIRILALFLISQGFVQVWVLSLPPSGLVLSGPFLQFWEIFLLLFIAFLSFFLSFLFLDAY